MKYEMNKRLLSIVPDWFAIGIRVKSLTDRSLQGTVYGIDLGGLVYVFWDATRCIRLVPFKELQPIEVWEPKEGELVACWNDEHINVSIKSYYKDDYVFDNYNGTFAYHHMVKIDHEAWKAAGYTLAVEWWKENVDEYSC